MRSSLTFVSWKSHPGLKIGLRDTIKEHYIVRIRIEPHSLQAADIGDQSILYPPRDDARWQGGKTTRTLPPSIPHTLPLSQPPSLSPSHSLPPSFWAVSPTLKNNPRTKNQRMRTPDGIRPFVTWQKANRDVGQESEADRFMTVPSHASLTSI